MLETGCSMNKSKVFTIYYLFYLDLGIDNTVKQLTHFRFNEQRLVQYLSKFQEQFCYPNFVFLYETEDNCLKSEDIKTKRELRPVEKYYFKIQDQLPS